MSTRSHVHINEKYTTYQGKEEQKSKHYYHHHDGYPLGVGRELIEICEKTMKWCSEYTDITRNLDINFPRAYEEYPLEKLCGGEEYIYYIEIEKLDTASKAKLEIFVSHYDKPTLRTRIYCFDGDYGTTFIHLSQR